MTVVNRQAKTGMHRTRTVTGHVIQNPGVTPANSRIEHARFSDVSFPTAVRIARGPPNTDRRRYLVK